MTRRPLPCVLPPAPPQGCCAPSLVLPAAPVEPYNPPGLSEIRYRIGTFTSFRRAMLDEIAAPALLGSLENPFARWTEGADGDYQTMFVELWAYLADILTFYQERIANEAYIATAGERDSLRRLAALVNYRPSPGAGALGVVAFTAEKGKRIFVPQSLRVGSKAQPPNLPAVFETEDSVTADSRSNAIPLSPVGPKDQFAKLSSIGKVYTMPNIDFQDAGDVFGDFGRQYLSGFDLFGVDRFQPGRSFGFSRGRKRTAPPPKTFSTTTRTVVFKGVNNRLSAGDWVVVVENEGKSGEKATPWMLSTDSVVDKASATTTVTWEETAETQYGKDVAVYVLRVTAGVFGSTAPNFNTLSSALNGDFVVMSGSGTPETKSGPLKGQNWDDLDNSWAYLPTPTDSASTLFLDGVHDIAATAASPGWAVLSSDKGQQVVHVLDAAPVSKAAYTVSAKTTRLIIRERLDQSPFLRTFPIRTTGVRAGSERLELENNLPLPDPVRGDTLLLSGLQSQLRASQTVVFQGEVFGSAENGAEPVVNAELRTLKQAPAIDTVNNITAVILNKPLDFEYKRAGALLMGNVTNVTQGETVAREVLGSGSGQANQSLSLKKKPLTYLPTSNPVSALPVENTLVLTVNGVRWAEVPSLIDSMPDAQVYTVRENDAGSSTVEFGDGFNGARPPTATGNIVARYRKGLGTSGNVAAGLIQQLVDSVASVQKVVNPLPASGGADPETASQIRQKAPATVRTFGRAVSAADYAEFALTFPGIAKASASYVSRDASYRALANPYVRLTVATTNGQPLATQPDLLGRLRAFLDSRRDPNVRLRIVDFTPVFIDVSATINVDGRFGRQATLALAQAAMNPGVNPDGSLGYFSFDRLRFGESIFLSGIYAALQQVPGVKDVIVTVFRRLSPDPSDPTLILDTVFVGSSEIAIIANEPGDPSEGTLTITLGEGGFEDA